VSEVLAVEDEAAIANEEPVLVNEGTEPVRLEEEKAITEAEDIAATNPEINSKEVIETSSNAGTAKVTSAKK
jgi:RecB family endonuclease NucS